MGATVGWGLSKGSFTNTMSNGFEEDYAFGLGTVYAMGYALALAMFFSARQS